MTGKSQRKIRKMVYGKFFRKPFSKTRVLLPLKSRLSTQSLLSLFLALDFADLGFATRQLSGAVGFATRLRLSGDRNRDPPPLATVTHLEPVSLSHPGDRTVAELKISSRDPPPLTSRDPPRFCLFFFFFLVNDLWL